MSEDVIRVRWESAEELPAVRKGQRIQYRSGSTALDAVVVRGARYANRRKAWADVAAGAASGGPQT